MKRRQALVALSVGISMLLFVAALASLAPAHVLAESGDNASRGYSAANTGLVPCNGVDCQACSAVKLIQNIINFLIGISIPIAMVLFAWAGVLYFTSATNVENVSHAKAIFRKVFLGFIVVLGAYLMVETVFHAVLKESYFQDWNHVECVDNRPINTNLGQLINEVIGTPHPVTYYVADGSIFSCSTGLSYDNTTGKCTSADGKTTAAPIRSSVQSSGSGSCSTYGLSAQQSCIASFESSCNPGVGSGVDIGADRNPVSWGLFQINLSANDVTCSNINGGQTLDCTSAFSGGAYTASNHTTRVSDQALFDACRNAVQNIQCNVQMQQKIMAAQGIGAWGNAARNNCSAL